MLVYYIKFSLDSCRKWNIWYDFQKLHFHKLVFKCFPVIHNCANNLGKIKKKFLWKTYVNITKIIYHLTHFFSSNTWNTLDTGGTRSTIKIKSPKMSFFCLFCWLWTGVCPLDFFVQEQPIAAYLHLLNLKRYLIPSRQLHVQS